MIEMLVKLALADEKISAQLVEIEKKLSEIQKRLERDEKLLTELMGEGSQEQQYTWMDTVAATAATL